MPAVSRERVSSLLNFIVQLASHIWVLESLGGFAGRGALAPAAAVELEAAPPHPGSCVWGRLGSPESQGGGTGEGDPPPALGAPFGFWAPGGAAGAEGGGCGGRQWVFFY